MSLDTVSEVPYIGAVGFTKLFSSLIFSTVWREPMHVKVLWITMLAMANRNGEVWASVPGLADAAKVSVEQCREALARLSSPDPDSRTKDHEGRRIQEVDGGWRILNYPKYRELRDADERRLANREYQRQHRARSARHMTVSKRQTHQPPSAQAEAEAEAEADTTLVGLKPDGRHVAHRFEDIKEHLSTVLAQVTAGERQRFSAGEIRTAQAELVFAYWQVKLGHTKALLDRKRLVRLEGHLRENGGNVHELLYAIDGWLKDPTFQRLNEQDGRKLDGIENIFTDRGRIERLAGHCKTWRESETPHPMAVKYLEGLSDIHAP